MEWYDAKQTSRHEECCDDMENWQFYRSVIDDEELRLEGLNIWDHPWKASGESISVNDPIYQQSHRMNVYKITEGALTVHFAAGEFSNRVWGIYVPRNHAGYEPL